MSAVPLFIVCANPSCGQVKQVRNRYEQRTVKTCSRRCQGILFGHIQKLTSEQRQVAAARSTVVRRARAMRALAGLSPLEIYRRAFSNGWKAGVRSARRRLTRTA